MDFSRLRTLSASNSVVGAVVVTQRRSARTACPSGDSGNPGIAAFTSSHGINCSAPDLRDSRPFGIDPAFSRFSALFNGKHVATEYYNGQLLPDLATQPEQSFEDPLEGYYGPEGFVPYGFFPHQWDTVARRPKEPGKVLASAVDEFKLFFDVRADSAQAGLLLAFMRDGRFLDEATAAVDVEVVTYNADLAMFASIRFTFQVRTCLYVSCTPETDYLRDNVM